MDQRLFVNLAAFVLALFASAAALGCSCPTGEFYRGLPLLGGGCQKHQCPGGSFPMVSQIAVEPVPADNPTHGGGPATVCGCMRGQKWSGSRCENLCSDTETFGEQGVCFDSGGQRRELFLPKGYNELPFQQPCPWPDCQP